MKLYTSTQVEPAARRDQLSRDVISILRVAYEMSVWGCFPERDGAVYVQAGFEGGYDLWVVADNGGEFTVAKVNLESETQRDVPYVERGVPVDAGTVAYRIAMVVKGEPIEWDLRCPELVGMFTAQERFASIKVLYRAPQTMALWGIPYEMRPGQQPRHLAEAGDSYVAPPPGYYGSKQVDLSDWVYLGSPGWYSGPGEEAHLAQAFLDSLDPNVIPRGPYEWLSLAEQPRRGRRQSK